MGRRIGPATIEQYSLEFKLKAVQLSSQPGVLIKDVAESLCIHPFMLSKWRKQVRDGELVGDPPAIEPQEAAELRRLRDVEQQFKRLQMEHDLSRRGIERMGEPLAPPVQHGTCHVRAPVVPAHSAPAFVPAASVAFRPGQRYNASLALSGLLIGSSA